MANLLFVLTIYCILSIVWCGCANKFKVTLYEHKNYKGKSAFFDDFRCWDLSTDTSKQASSIKVETGCVQVYQASACQYKYAETFSTDRNIGHPNTKKFNGFLQDSIVSIGPCSCGGKFKVELYEHRDFRGQMQAIESDKCQNLDAKLNDRASSVSSVDGCAAVYKDIDCKVFLDKYSTTNALGKIGSNNLQNYDINDAISSVRPCGSN